MDHGDMRHPRIQCVPQKREDHTAGDLPRRIPLRFMTLHLVMARQIRRDHPRWLASDASVSDVKRCVRELYDVYYSDETNEWM